MAQPASLRWNQGGGINQQSCFSPAAQWQEWLKPRRIQIAQPLSNGIGGTSNSSLSHQRVVTFSKRLKHHRFYILKLWILGTNLLIAFVDYGIVAETWVCNNSSFEKFDLHIPTQLKIALECWDFKTFMNLLPHSHCIPNSSLYIHFLGNFSLVGKTMDSFNLLLSTEGSKMKKILSIASFLTAL